MEIPLERLLPVDYPLVSFSGDLVSVKGSIRLPIRAGTYPRESRITMNFLVVDVPSSYNALLGRPGMIVLRTRQAFQRMEIPLERLLPVDYPLVSFSGDLVSVKGSIRLPIRAGTYPRELRITMNFLVVDVPSSYKALLGRPGMIALRSVSSPYHLVINFPTPRGAGESRTDQLVSRKCYSAELTDFKKPVP
ncbi:hypothetical protein NE237_010349 [Protea cynaroides]|uniref:Uncharacterized protein n=1 Tax=Protea cynaroides TaxID=273540 RepID=A0A9Q0L091_9MAGN|nr:hypothetical protein NE237_010349 [Protea cynaroides]